MALRCLLVSLVASLGFDLPSHRDVTSWKVMGRDWFAARAVDLSAMGAEASGWLGVNDPTTGPPAALAATPAAPEARAAAIEAAEVAEAAEAVRRRDLAFDAVGGVMAVALAADQRHLAETAVTPAPVAEATAIELAVVAPVESLCSPDEVADDMALPAPDAVASADEVDAETEAGGSPVPARRLSSAVRLTRDAVRAWASLVQSIGGEVLVR